MTKEQQTFYNYTITYPDGKVDTETYKSEKQFQEAQNDAKKVNAVIDVTRAQTFEVTTADSLDEIKTLTPNEEVALGYYNYGLTLAQHGAKRDYMRDPNWQAIEGVYDLLADVQQPKERRTADPLTKSRNSLKALWASTNPGVPLPSDEEINAVLAQFAGASAVSATVSE